MPALERAGHRAHALTLPGMKSRDAGRACIVYVDSGPVGEGGLINDELPAENGEIPLPDWSLFDKEDLAAALRTAFQEWIQQGHPAARELASVGPVS